IRIFRWNFPMLMLAAFKAFAMLAYEYGKNLGLAFQLLDDVLNFTSTSLSLGKGSLSDIHHETLKNIRVGRAARCSRMVERAEELAITLAVAKSEPKKEAAPESPPIGPKRGANVNGVYNS
nr:solanesyl diphosphate synthase 3, chloroplastic/mitochondrial isoform X2 [Tanacetum cinerariifolium]